MAAGHSPSCRSAEIMYLSSLVIWWYFIRNSPYLAVLRIVKYSRSPFFLQGLLHLLFEFAAPNKALQLTGHSAFQSIRGTIWH